MKALALLGLLACLETCSPVPLGDGDRRIVARELGAEIAVPTLDDLVVRLGELRTACEQLATLANLPALRDAQRAWRVARVPWKHADAFGFGPATELRLTAAMDQPIDAAKIEAEVLGTAEITDAAIAAFGADRKGFHALEYLLFGPNEAAQLATFTSSPTAARRRALVAAYAHDLEARARELREAWTGEQDLLAHPGAANASYPTVADSIDAFVNEGVFLAELAADTRLGKPSGTATGGVPQPELVESRPSDNSLDDLANSLRGLRNIYYGSRDGIPGKGIGGLIAASSPSTDHEMREVLEASIAAVVAIPRPFEASLVARAPEIELALTALKELRTVLATEVVGVLGATLKFNSNDGD